MELFPAQLAAAPVAGALLAMVFAVLWTADFVCLRFRPGQWACSIVFCLACVGQPCTLLVMLALAQCQPAIGM